MPEHTTDETDLNRLETEARIAKLMAETANLNRETLLYPLVVGSGFTLAAVALAKAILS